MASLDFFGWSSLYPRLKWDSTKYTNLWESLIISNTSLETIWISIKELKVEKGFHHCISWRQRVKGRWRCKDARNWNIFQIPDQSNLLEIFPPGQYNFNFWGSWLKTQENFERFRLEAPSCRQHLKNCVQPLPASRAAIVSISPSDMCMRSCIKSYQQRSHLKANRTQHQASRLYIFMPMPVSAFIFAIISSVSTSFWSRASKGSSFLPEDQGLALVESSFLWRVGGFFHIPQDLAHKNTMVWQDTFATKLSRRTIQDTGKATWQHGKQQSVPFPGFQATLRFLAAFFRKSFYTPGQWCRSEMRDTSRSRSAKFRRMGDSNRKRYPTVV